MIALMIGAHIDGVMIVRYRGGAAMPASDDKVIAAMKDAWLREIFPSTSVGGPADRDGVGFIPGLRESEAVDVLPQQAPSAPATRKHARSLRARHRM